MQDFNGIFLKYSLNTTMLCGNMPEVEYDNLTYDNMLLVILVYRYCCTYRTWRESLIRHVQSLFDWPFSLPRICSAAVWLLGYLPSSIPIIIASVNTRCSHVSRDYRSLCILSIGLFTNSVKPWTTSTREHSLNLPHNSIETFTSSPALVYPFCSYNIIKWWSI